MICALDVDYRAASVAVAAVAFEAWTDGAATLERVDVTPGAAAAYEPGQFYLRELPYLCGLLDRLPAMAMLIVDGYADLGHAPGLGGHLATARGVPVIGVAKTRYAGAPAIEVRRGDSKAPLYVTAAGVQPAMAAAWVASMHGPYRIPTLLKRVDSLARQGQVVSNDQPG